MCGDECKFSHVKEVGEAWKAKRPNVTLEELLEDGGLGDRFQDCVDQVRVMELLEQAEVPAVAHVPGGPKMYPAPPDVRYQPQYEDEGDDGVRVRRQRLALPSPLVDT